MEAQDTFHLRIDEMTPLIQDVAMLIGLSIDTTPVVRHEGSINGDALHDHSLKLVPPASTYKSNCIVSN